jgi:hypothetical protein
MTTVAELYQQVLGRAPDAGGLAYYQQLFGNSVDPNEASVFANAAAAELASRSVAAPTAPAAAPAPVATPAPAAAPAYVAPTLSGNATGRDLQLEMAKIYTNNLDPSIIANTPKKITNFTGLISDWAGTPSEPMQTYLKPVTSLINAVYDENGNLTGYEGNNNAYFNDNSYVHGSFDTSGKANPVYQTKSAGGFFQGQLPAMAALFGGALGANALGIGSEATGGLLSGATPTVNPYSLAADYGAPTAPGGLGITGNTTANLASMGGAQGLTTAGTGLTAATLGELGGIAPYAGLGAGIGTAGLVAGTGSLLGSGAASSAASALSSGAGIPPATPTVTPTAGTTPTVSPAGTVPDILGKVATGVGTGLLGNAANTLLNPSTIQGGLQTAGGLMQTQASKDAAVKAQQDILTATQQATTGSQFRPVGVTTKFGSSQFQIDPATGQLVSAGYTAAPEIVSAQNQLMKLGAGYLAQTPEQVAQQYLSKQYELLDPSRQRQLADIRNQSFQTGRTGLSVGSTGLRPSGAQGLMGSNPEMEAYYNALAQQDAQLAANAQQAGQQQVTYGAGLFGQAGNLESLAQQPFTLGTGLGTSISGAGANAGRLSLTGQQLGSSYGTSNAATTNPFAYLLSGAGSPTLAIGQGLYNWLTSSPSTATNIAKGNDLMAGADYSF